MHPLSIPAFLERVSREEDVDLTPLTPFVERLAKNTQELSHAYPRELFALGLSREHSELLVRRACGWERRSKYDVLELFFGLDGVLASPRPFPIQGTPSAKPERWRE